MPPRWARIGRISLIETHPCQCEIVKRASRAAAFGLALVVAPELGVASEAQPHDHLKNRTEELAQLRVGER